MEETLYQDKYVSVTNKNFIIHSYYFPSGASKTIPRDKIKMVQYESASFFKAKAWGMALTNVWFARDMDRTWSKVAHKYMSVTTDSYVKKGFSTDDPITIFDLLVHQKN